MKIEPDALFDRKHARFSQKCTRMKNSRCDVKTISTNKSKRLKNSPSGSTEKRSGFSTALNTQKKFAATIKCVQIYCKICVTR